ncbi:PAS domain-containing protein [Pseudoponticoccus marisrubri]|uniref:Diguanylate cyclase n=1 Tax=Pseudoponticoccus marisrubri TaxID=1685382 RepID=A0A0W7WM41_9RHOB|nr:PAS domain-containing protein [Pseudoponticoccus marisrubri]KUF11638.1 diguanylate cyclase [Pseudoponticoccus marisrubri]
MSGKGDRDDHVVSMMDRERARREAPLRQVEAYWHGLCAEGQVPARSAVDPRGIEDALENAFLLERIAPSMAKIRVAGSHLSDLMGMNVAGMPLASLIVPAERTRFGQAVTHLFADPAILRLELRAEGGFGKPGLEATMLLMPLASDFGDLSRGLGALVSHGRIGRAPRRFVIHDVEITPALRPGVLAAPPVSAPAPRATGFAEGQAPFRRRARPDTPTRRHLRLVVSNDD